MGPGRRLDELVADKVFGETIFKHKAGWEPLEYSTDIKAAWEIVDRMVNLGYSFVIANDRIAPPVKETIGYKGSWASFGITGQKLEPCKGDSIPHAICLSALKAFE